MNIDSNLYSNPVLATYECEGQLTLEDCFPTTDAGKDTDKNSECKKDREEGINSITHG